jgi:hypothetical protein
MLLLAAEVLMLLMLMLLLLLLLLLMLAMSTMCHATMMPWLQWVVSKRLMTCAEGS